MVSGLARGADTEAHVGALSVKEGRTVAVLAWFDPLYPPDNEELSKSIEQRGAIISERYERPKSFAAGTFVERNRITSGISRCVIAVESDEEVGRCIKFALQLCKGRRSFAVTPKNGDTRAMRGFRMFMKMGAIPISSSDPVVEFLRAGERDEILETYLNPQTKLRT